VQADPLATHLPARQHPPPWQLFAAQQAFPAVPQLVTPVPPTGVDDPPHDATATAATIKNTANERKW
jgi:hypothetical protein